MDHILHPKKEKPRNASQDRITRKDKKGSLAMKQPRSGENSRSRRGSASMAVLPDSAKFEMIMESPPALFIGTTSYSSGALLSGRLKVNVQDPSGEVKFIAFTQELRMVTTTKKPISKECEDCSVHYEVLKHWDIIKEPKTFQKNLDHQYPWSFLLPGKLPATTTTVLGSISYEIAARATTSTGETLKFSHPIMVQRAIPPGGEKASIRIFPPTNLTGRVVMPPVVHPIGKFPVSLTLSGVVEKRRESQTRWRLKKTMWRVEEHVKVTSQPCEKHKIKVAEGKTTQYFDAKQLGSDDIKTGWKTDFDTAGGEIVLEFEAQLATKPYHKAVCNVDAPSALEVKHNLVVELIVAEEFVPNKNTSLITPTGAARVLRMQFALNVTDRAGMGISWDDEQPPMYEDVPASPPGYGGGKSGAFDGAFIEDYHGPELDYVDLERVVTTNPNDPPLYREMDPAKRNVGLPMREPMGSSADSSGEAGPSVTRRLAGFSLDELEAEPQYRRRENSQDNDVITEEFGEGETGAVAGQEGRNH